MSNSRIVKCPQCKQDAIYSAENPFRPFCSHRCRLIDLGEWVEGRYSIASEETISEEIFSNDNLDSEPHLI